MYAFRSFLVSYFFQYDCAASIKSGYDRSYCWPGSPIYESNSVNPSCAIISSSIIVCGEKYTPKRFESNGALSNWLLSALDLTSNVPTNSLSSNLILLSSNVPAAKEIPS